LVDVGNRVRGAPGGHLIVQQCEQGPNENAGVRHRSSTFRFSGELDVCQVRMKENLALNLFIA
jgi:hypothetical protein